MKAAIVSAICRRLMQRHDVREGHLPEVIKLDQHLFKHVGEVAHLIARECCKARVSCIWRDKYLVGITSEVGQESNGRFVFSKDATTILLFGTEDILKQHSSRFGKVSLAGACFGLDGFEDKIGGIDLAMWVRIGYAHHLALVFKNKHVLDPRPAAKFFILCLPDVP